MNNLFSHTTCPAIFISAPASGQGKTTITAGLARYHLNQGKKVRVFKTGPDYLDPLILEYACQSPVEQLDLWMMGIKNCQQQLYQAACEADIILVEGVMGLFDGEPSGADLAKQFNLPVAVVINASAMAQTFAAITYGLSHYDPALNFYGVIANQTGSPRHRELIAKSLTNKFNLLGSLGRQQTLVLPHRHLGLINPAEVQNMDEILEHIAAEIATAGITNLPPVVQFNNVPSTHNTNLNINNKLKGKSIAIAKDEAFNFIYASNIRLLQQLGLSIEYFSPLYDKYPPQCDILWLPGGYPELHLNTLQQNQSMKTAIRQHFKDNKVILAECGGMLYLQQNLSDLDNNTAKMVGILPGNGIMRQRGGCQGMQTAPLPEGNIKGHAHHRSISKNTLTAIAHGKRIKHPAPGEKIFRLKKLTASYIHLYFPSNPQAIIRLLQ